MSWLLRPALVAAVLLRSMEIVAFYDDPKPDINPGLAAADQFYRAGKFAEAEASYQALLKSDSNLLPANLVAAQVGLVRARLRQQKIDEALDAVNVALTTQPNAAVFG
jgi:tetratricopeptide (TPR) repeat protein